MGKQVMTRVKKYSITEQRPNYAFNPIAEQALGSNQTIVPQRVNAALDFSFKQSTRPESKSLGTSLIRFAIAAVDSDSGQRTGILVAAHDLREDWELSVLEHEVVRLELAWFNNNLPVPQILDSEEHRRAISWFKPSANEAIQRMWRLKAVLGVHGIDVEVLKTEEPGVIVYEDEFQVIAKPRKGRRF